MNMKIKNWIACVQDRGKWKEDIEKAKISTRKFSAWRRRRRRRERRRRRRRRRRRNAVGLLHQTEKQCL
jgi:hypothetical protein